MGDLRIPAPGQETTYWSDYSANKLREVVRSWVELVESGVVAHHLLIGEDQPTTEHLRIAKSFLG